MSDGVVARAILAGTLVRQPCSRCGASTKTDAHHEDYSKPLDVVWLCRRCHLQRHRELRQQSTSVRTYIWLDPDVKRAAERAAKADQRSLSAFIAKLVADWANALAKPAKEQRR